MCDNVDPSNMRRSGSSLHYRRRSAEPERSQNGVCHVSLLSDVMPIVSEVVSDIIRRVRFGETLSNECSFNYLLQSFIIRLCVCDPIRLLRFKLSISPRKGKYNFTIFQHSCALETLLLYNNTFRNIDRFLPKKNLMYCN